MFILLDISIAHPLLSLGLTLGKWSSKLPVMAILSATAFSASSIRSPSSSSRSSRFGVLYLIQSCLSVSLHLALSDPSIDGIPRPLAINSRDQACPMRSRNLKVGGRTVTDGKDWSRKARASLSARIESGSFRTYLCLVSWESDPLVLPLPFPFD